MRDKLWDLQDELENDNYLIEALGKWMSADDVNEFVEDFRRNHDMPEGWDEEEEEEEEE